MRPDTFGSASRSLVILTAFLGSAAPAALAKHVHKAESTVQINDDGTSGRTTNRTFQVVNDLPGKVRLLLQQEIDEPFQDDEPGPGQVRIDAWRLPRSPKSKPLYSISQPGSEVAWWFYPTLLSIRIRACCDSSGSYAVFNAATGKMLAYSNTRGNPGESFASVMRDGITMVIGLLDGHSGRRPALFPEPGQGRPLLITTADSSSCRQQLLFTFPDGRDKMALYLKSVGWEQPKVGTVSGLRIDLRRQDRLDAILRVVLSDDRTISLPVLDEGISPSKVVPVAGATMKEISPCKL
jgi:hypothetical protein